MYHLRILLSPYQFSNQFIKGSYKVYSWKPDEETYRVRSGRVLSTGDLGCITLLVHGSIHQPGNSCDPHTSRICLEVSSCRHDGSFTPFPAFLPSQENGEQGWKFQALTIVPKYKIHQRKFEDVIDSIQWWMNWAASHLGNRKEHHCWLL